MAWLRNYTQGFSVRCIYSFIIIEMRGMGDGKQCQMAAVWYQISNSDLSESSLCICFDLIYPK